MRLVESSCSEGTNVTYHENHLSPNFTAPCPVKVNSVFFGFCCCCFSTSAANIDLLEQKVPLVKLVMSNRLLCPVNWPWRKNSTLLSSISVSWMWLWKYHMQVVLILIFLSCESLFFFKRFSTLSMTLEVKGHILFSFTYAYYIFATTLSYNNVKKKKKKKS